MLALGPFGNPHTAVPSHAHTQYRDNVTNVGVAQPSPVTHPSFGTSAAMEGLVRAYLWTYVARLLGTAVRN